MRKIIIGIILLLLSVHVFAQPGKHGDEVVSQTDVIVNEYARLVADAEQGDETIALSSVTMNDNGRFDTDLEPGDLLMIIQMHGAWTETTLSGNGLFGLPNTNEWGEISDYNNCGNYEFVTVTNIINTVSVEINCGLLRNYTSNANVQVVRMPRYDSLEVEAGASITADPWNGQFGGIVAIEVDGDAVINGEINTSEIGFRGGLRNNESGYGAGYYTSPMIDRGAEKGEGVLGFHFEYDNYFVGRYCKGAAGNGGGGATNHNAGGGGGANAGNIDNWTGKGVPSLDDPDWAQAWELEEAGLSTTQSSGGGRGGYSQSGANLSAFVVPPGDTDWGGDYRRVNNGLGGRPLDYSMGRLFFGGGGGAGEENDNDGGAGGNAGGMIFLKVNGEITGTGDFISNGQRGEDSDNPAAWGSQGGKDGCGGGGSGGTIVLNADSGVVNTISIIANGGEGGDQYLTSFFGGTIVQAEGPGGGGGGGYIAISSGNPNREALGGEYGTTNSPSLNEFIPNGATSGAEGLAFEIYESPFPSVAIPNVAFCPPDEVIFEAIINGDPSGVTIEWFEDEDLTTLLGTGITYDAGTLTEATTIYARTCPGGVQPVQAFIDSPNAGVVEDTLQICEGNSVMLEAYGGVSYLWYPNQDLDDDQSATPVASPTTSTTFYVDIDAGGCIITDTVFVDVTTDLDVQISNDTLICYGDEITLEAFADNATSYNWSPNENITGENTATPQVSPTSNTTYVVEVDDGLCSGTASVLVEVTNELTVSVEPEDTTVCVNDTLFFEAESNGAFGAPIYEWYLVSTGNTISSGSELEYYFTEDTQIGVEVEDDLGCTASTEIEITTLPAAEIEITDYTACDGEEVTLEPTFSGGTGSGDFEWTIDGVTVSNDPTYTLSVDEATEVCVSYTGGCSSPATDCAQISIIDEPEFNIVLSDDTICSGETTGIMVILDSGFGTPDSYTWFVNGEELNGESVSATFDTPGTYTFDLLISYSTSCEFIHSDVASLEVVEYPVAAFTANPQTVIVDQTEVAFENTSTGANTYLWDFANEGNSAEENPSFVFPEATGTYEVTLTASNDNHCSDEYTLIITIIDELVIPNIFSPNHDGRNDLFVVSGLPHETRLVVFNRWGEQVFEAINYDNTWNGTHNNGSDLSEGTYFFILEFKDGKKEEGSVMIVR